MKTAYLVRLIKLPQLLRLYSLVHYIGAAHQYKIYVDPLLRWITSWFIALIVLWISWSALVHATARERAILNPNDANWLSGFYFHNNGKYESTIYSVVGVLYYVLVTMCAVGYGSLSVGCCNFRKYWFLFVQVTFLRQMRLKLVWPRVFN